MILLRNWSKREKKCLLKLLVVCRVLIFGVALSIHQKAVKETSNLIDKMFENFEFWISINFEERRDE